MPVSQTALLALVLAALASACCRGKSTPHPEPTPAVAPAAAPKPAARPAASMPAAGPPGWAYVNARDLVGIDPSGNVVTLKPKKGYVSEVVRASDGNAYALISGSGLDITLLQGDSTRSVGTLPKCYASGGAFDARGEHMAVRCSKSVFEKAGASWNELPLPGDGYDHTLWIAKDGTLWYGSNHGVYERKGSEWTQPQGKSAFTESPKDFFDGPDGVYFTTSSSRIMRVTDGKLVEVHEQKQARLGLDPASNGLLGYWDRKSSLALFTLAGEVKTVSTKAWLARGRLDDTGRAWSVVDGQLEIAEPTTGTVTTVPMGSYAELDRLTISSKITVLGSGPAAPAAKPVRKTRAITGKLVMNGKPLANTALELCPRSDWTYAGSTPCSGAPATVHFKTTTDDKGSFSVSDAPMGLYYIHYKTAGASKWAVDSTALDKLRENAVSNIGTVQYRSKK